MKDIIAEEVTNCEAKLIRQTRHYQGNAMTIFSSNPTYTLLGAIKDHIEYDDLQKILKC